MSQIHILSSDTINRIAAGEVVERPSNVVKELTENALDAGADAITIEIRGGGVDLIRVTDNGCGIEPSEVRRAFLRHATSKISDAGDLMHLSSLGFRGEALSSIAAVSEVEMITKTAHSLSGIRAVNAPSFGESPDASFASVPSSNTEHGPGSGPDSEAPAQDRPGAASAPLREECPARSTSAPAPAPSAPVSREGYDPEGQEIPLQLSEIGAPDGTTVIVRNLFYNVPVRRRFLKSAQTEGSYVTDLVEHLALSHPFVSFHYRMNGQEKLHTTGNGSIPELIYRIYGKEMSRSVIPFGREDAQSGIQVTGYLGRPEFARSSRSFELFYVNGRMLRSDVLSKGLEEGYRTDLMQHRFPFAIVYLTVPPERIDVNVHPSKMEVRFTDPKTVYDLLNESVHAALHAQELIPHETMNTKAEDAALVRDLRRRREEEQKAQPHLEAFERSAPQRRPAQNAEDSTPSGSGSPSGPGSPRGFESPSGPGSFGTSGMPDCSPEHAAEDTSFTAEKTSAAGTAELSSASEETDTSETGYAFSAAGKISAAGKTLASETQDLPLYAQDAPPLVHRAEDSFTFIDKTARYTQASLFDAPSLPSQKSAQEAETRRQKALDENLLLPSHRMAPHPAAAKDGAETGEDDPRLLTRENARRYKYIGQIFDTYWIIEFDGSMLMIDQHAAHEKVNFERLMARLSREQEEGAASQMLMPPIVVSLSGREEAALEQYQEYFTRMGYEIEPFGENTYAIHAVPAELYGNAPDELLRGILDEILETRMSGTPAAILYKIASMSCKAAIKGNTRMSVSEAEDLIDELLRLDNPYHCPHGRPTMIVLSQAEIDRKFKRIVS